MILKDIDHDEPTIGTIEIDPSDLLRRSYNLVYNMWFSLHPNQTNHWFNASLPDPNLGTAQARVLLEIKMIHKGPT